MTPVASVAAFIVAGLLLLHCAAPGPSRSSDPTEMTRELRAMVLDTELGRNDVAVVMDVARPDATLTVFGASTGDASLYSTNGGAVIGGTVSPKIRAAAVAFAQEAARQESQFTKVSEYPLPAAGKVRFYVKTASGVSMAERSLDSLDALEPLHRAGERVIAELEASGIKLDRGGSSASDRRRSDSEEL